MNPLVVAIGSACGDIGKAAMSVLASNCYSNTKIFAFDENPICTVPSTIVSRSPSCKLESFNSWLNVFLTQNHITHYVPSSEYEMRAISSEVDSSEHFRVIWAGNQIFHLFDDKFTGSKFLEMNSFDVPKLMKINELEGTHFSPCVIKPRRSSGSRGVTFCNSEKEMRAAISSMEDFIVQEFIPFENNEYTVGVYRSAEGEVRSIILNRMLQNGRTSFAKVVKDDDIAEKCNRLANILKLNGSINVQIRKYQGLNFIFEVNPRFSSTLQGRHLLGFQDLLWSLGSSDLPLQEDLDRNIGKSIARNREGEFYLL